MKPKSSYISAIMLLLLFSACSTSNNVASEDNTETVFVSVSEKNTENVSHELVKKEELNSTETTYTTLGEVKDIQPTPQNAYNYVNEISAKYHISNYSISEIMKEADRENKNITIDDEVLLQQKMGYDIFQEASEHFGISFQETVNLFVEGASEIENAHIVYGVGLTQQ